MRAILNHTMRGDVMHDPFPGSTVTLIAAEITGWVGYRQEFRTGPGRGRPERVRLPLRSSEIRQEGK
ncbi:MAG: hypothetical protein ABSE86_35700 [Bryobacteraceae bacterium]|jgi:hypothetical protein